MKIKILCVVREVLPFPGGYSIRGENIFNELSKYFDIHVAVSNYNNSCIYPSNRFQRNEVNYYIHHTGAVFNNNRIAKIHGSGFFVRMLKRYLFYEKLKKLADMINPDIIVAHTPADVAMPAVPLSKELKKPLIFDVRQFYFSNNNNIRGAYDKMMIRKIVKNSDAFASISNGTEKIIKTFFGKSDDRIIAHIPNGISKDFIEKAERAGASEKKMASLREKYGIDDLVIGYIGTISEYEGLDLLINVYSKINPENSTLLIVGDGPYFKKIQDKIGGIGKENIKIPGRVPYDDVFRFYKLIDLFVLPRISNPLTESVTPIKPMEIMYSKKPLICSSVGGFTEIIENGKNGFVFEANNENDLEKCMRNFLHNKGRINQIVNNAFEMIEEKYSWEVIGKSYRELICNVMKRYNSRRHLPDKKMSDLQITAT